MKDLDANNQTMTQALRQEDEYDKLSSLFEKDVKESVMEEIMNDNELLFDFMAELPENILVVLAETIYLEQAGITKEKDYTYLGEQLIQGLSKTIEESVYFGTEVENYIENRIAEMHP